MKAFYLSLLFMFISLTAFTQSANRIAIHVEGGVKYNFKYDDYSGSHNDYDENRGFSGAQFFVSGLYSLNNNLSAGVGAGINIYTRYITYFDGITSVPIYANVFYKLPTSKDFMPFIDLKLGYGIVSRSYVTSPQSILTLSLFFVRQQKNQFIQPCSMPFVAFISSKTNVDILKKQTPSQK